MPMLMTQHAAYTPALLRARTRVCAVSVRRAYARLRVRCRAAQRENAMHVRVVCYASTRFAAALPCPAA